MSGAQKSGALELVGDWYSLKRELQSTSIVFRVTSLEQLSLAEFSGK